jgi:hypothetical protein
MKSGAIRVYIDQPTYAELTDRSNKWARSIYGNIEELVPHNAPTALGEAVALTTYVDANLYQGMITGCSVTGILHLVNQTPFEWFSKRQATVKTATYGSEFVAARIAVEQIIDVRITMRYLGVAVKGKYLCLEITSQLSQALLSCNCQSTNGTMLCPIIEFKKLLQPALLISRRFWELTILPMC